MHRRRLQEMLSHYEARHRDDRNERETVDRVRGLVEAHPDCFERTCLPGHVTASAWILSADRRSFLLTHHRKLDRWLQLGGHVDGDPDVSGAALREAREESGMERFAWGLIEGDVMPIDIDVHRIPAFGAEPAHEHHDVRFLLIADADQPLNCSHESTDLRWFDIDRLDEIATEESLHRLGRKARLLLPALETCAATSS